ncbi:MAG: flavodoxin family protein, partial [Treponema sp.]|nr:flavodoxin family protein [Treponema sp.]
MKVIAVNGSPHENGVTAKGISVMKAELEKEGIDVEVIHAGNKIIRGCTDCRKCKKAGRCVTEDPTDTVNEVYVKMQAADGLILGCPVYYGSIAGTFKCLL